MKLKLMNMIDLLEYNKTVFNDFQNNKSIYTLQRYIMSELLSPIEDYTNVVETIQENLILADTDLLIIGAFVFIEHMDAMPKQNHCLDRLNTLAKTTEREDAIISYLNALNIFRSNPYYYIEDYFKINLKKSIDCKIKFVNNRLLYAMTYHSKQLLEDARKNIVKVYTENELNDMSYEFLYNIENYINEYVLGTHINYICYEAIIQNSTM